MAAGLWRRIRALSTRLPSMVNMSKKIYETIDEAPLYGKHEQEDLRDDRVRAILRHRDALHHHGRSQLLLHRQPHGPLHARRSLSYPDIGHRCMRVDRYPDIGHLTFDGYGLTAIGLVMYIEVYLVAISFVTSATAACAYADIGHLTFGGYGLTAISLIMYVEVYLVAISFVILLGENLDKLLPGTVVEILEYQVHGKQLFVLAAATVILPTTWLKNLSVLAYLGGRAGLVSCADGVAEGVANKASLVWTSVADKADKASLVWAGMADKGFHMAGSNLLNLSGLSTALSLYFVCFAGHGVFPGHCIFLTDLLISSVMCSLNYTVTAVLLGYLSYGEDVQVQVTLNLPTGKLYTKVAILTTLITPLAKYVLVIQPVTMAIEEKLSAMMAAVADNRNNGLTRVLTSSRRCQHDAAGVHFALLRLPHIVHRVLTERRRCHAIPVPELPQDLHAPRRSCPLRGGGDRRDTGHWSVRRHRWHLHLPSPDYRHILIGHLRPTSLHDRGRDSDDDDFRDRDYDVAALANNLSQAF
uniref:Amino acid transporter transmembrane domain-containing protein n=1 Tax=Oryza meridionalis TaxID=40149 RepID=A0A0E0C3X8_9ORYZ